MPRTQRMIMDDQSTVYHAWDVETNSFAILLFIHNKL